MVNTKHDANTYECVQIGRKGYQREIYDGNLLYESFRKASKGSNWKPDVQRFEMTWLLGITDIQQELKDKAYEFDKVKEFILHERGKIRAISSETIEDRIVEHALCDEKLVPAVQRFLIYDNGASLENKGIDFTRKRLVRHLQNYYRKNGSNEGYILLIDFTKYYDNVQHEKLYRQFKKYVFDDYSLWLFSEILKDSRVDVSYMTDEEYVRCMTQVFNSLEYRKLDKSVLTRDKFMSKHLDIGKQSAQISGVTYRTPIDNYVKIVKGLHEYGAYMDDSYAIHESKAYLENLLKDIIKIADEYGITINRKKTRIVKLSSYWRFLQIQYSLTETGKIIKKINPKRLSTMRHRMKAVAPKVTKTEFTNWYKSWFKGNYKIMSKLQRENMDKLFNELLKEAKDVHDNSYGWNKIGKPRYEWNELCQLYENRRINFYR